jgi:hypothetical protein
LTPELALAGIVSAVVLGRPDGALLDALLPDAEWSQVVRLARRERVIGLLAAAVEQELVPVTQEQLDLLADTQRVVVGGVLHLDRLLLRIDDTLTASGIDYRVLKGPVMAHTVYAEPGLRHYGDVDVLVRGDTFARAVEALAVVGAERPVAALRPGFDERFGKGATLRTPEKMEIDLHRTFVAGPLGFTVDLAELFQAADRFELGGRRLPCLDLEHRFLHACFGVALDRKPRLANLVDIVEVLRQGDADLDRVERLARRWRSSAVVARGVAIAAATLRVETMPLLDWARAYEPTSMERRMLGSYVGDDQSYARRAMGSLRVIPGARAKLSYGWALLVPSSDHLGDRKTGLLTHVRRGARHILPTRHVQ